MPRKGGARTSTPAPAPAAHAPPAAAPAAAPPPVAAPAAPSQSGRIVQIDFNKDGLAECIMTQKITEVLAEAGFSSDIIAATAISVKAGERRARITMPTTSAAIQLVEFTRDNPVKLDGRMIFFKEVQYLKTFSLDGGKIIFKDDRVEREKERQAKKSEYEKNHAEYLQRQERKKAAEEKKAARPEPPSRSVKRPSDASDTLSERSCCSSVSTVASLALSLDEERQVRKMERKLRDIAHLEELQAQGVVLDKLQVAKIAGKADIESSAVMRVVMLKVRAGAVRPALV